MAADSTNDKRHLLMDAVRALALAGHLWTRKGWVYAGCYHRECNLCGRIVSKPLKGETK